MDDIHAFYELAVGLCGKNDYRFGRDMLKYLEGHKIDRDNRDRDLLSESIYLSVFYVSRLERQQLNSVDEIDTLFQLIMLFAKILK